MQAASELLSKTDEHSIRKKQLSARIRSVRVVPATAAASEMKQSMRVVPAKQSMRVVPAKQSMRVVPATTAAV